jgi:hypothetical protein
MFTRDLNLGPLGQKSVDFYVSISYKNDSAL